MTTTRCWVINTEFEHQLITHPASPFAPYHPPSLQLQYLGLLLASPGDYTYVSHLPKTPETLHSLLSPLGIEPNYTSHFPSSLTLTPWGVSPAIIQLSKSCSTKQNLGLLSEIKKWNDKRTLLSQGLNSFASQLTSMEEVERYIQRVARGVLKAPFGMSGRGVHAYTPTSTLPLKWAKRTLLEQGSLLGEPLHNVQFLFSSLWWINEQGPHYLHATEQVLTRSCRYAGTRISQKLGDKLTHYLPDHKWQAIPLLTSIYNKGYQGPCGLDAYTYLENGVEVLRPIAEINLRYTMGFVAHAILQRLTKHQTLTLAIKAQPDPLSLVPQHLVSEKGEELHCPLSLRMHLS